ncbi:MAG: lactate utilization protein [Exilibacterium sp.]
MKDDQNLNAEQALIFEKLSARVVISLKKKYINAHYAPKRGDALATILDMIPKGATVGTADSLSLLQVGILNALKKRGRNEIINPFRRDDEGKFIIVQEKRVELMTKIFSSDVFLIGTNAITFDGKLVNTDGFGNRVSAMIFGPKKVIIVVGANKIVKDLDSALNRIRNIAPVNAARHAIKHNAEGFKDLPCVQSGICVNCNQPCRICHYTTIIDGEQERRKGHLNVVVVGEQLGI